MTATRLGSLTFVLLFLLGCSSGSQSPAPPSPVPTQEGEVLLNKVLEDYEFTSDVQLRSKPNG